MDLTTISPLLGAEIGDFNPAAAAADGGQSLRRALDRYRLLLIRGQTFTDTAHIELLSRFGNVMSESGVSYYDPIKDKISYVTTKPGKYIANTLQFLFHADYQFTIHGAAQVFSLCAMELNRSESTLFANMVAAVDLLPARLRERVQQLKIVQCVSSLDTQTDGKPQRQRFNRGDPKKDYAGYVAIHPAIGKHPRTGELVLNVSQQFTSHFVGVSKEESEEILREIDACVYVDSNIYRHQWRLNDMLVWDNIALQHARDALDANYARVLRRVISNPLDLAQMLRLTREAGVERELAMSSMSVAHQR